MNLIAGVAVVCVVVGVVVLLVGPEVLGSGPGGLYGIPMMVLVLAAGAGLLIGGASVIRGRAPRDHWRALLVVAGPVLLMLAFFDGAHVLDPCSAGLWHLDATVGGVPLCQGWGTGQALEVHWRLHLLLHGIPTTALALLLRRAVRTTVVTVDNEERA